jgi:thioredoxin-dependent peroxiredoxin
MASKKKPGRAAKKSAPKPRPAAPAKKAKAKAKAKTKTKTKAKASKPAPVAKAKPKPKPASKKSAPAAKPKPVVAAAPKKSKPAKPKALAEENSVSIGEGDEVPTFELADQDGQTLSSATLAGEPYVVYFYPKDDTPGCTVEACGFRDSLSNFTARGVRVIGISPDSVQSHARFRDKHELTFTLLSDPEKELAKAFGVWVKKQNYGREYMGIERSTFVVDPNGVVHKAWKGVRVPGHVDQVLEAVRSLR